jgi:hypothetical protein
VKAVWYPKYKNITIKQLFQFADGFDKVKRRFPIEKERKRLPRWWIIQVLHSTIPNEFSAWADARVEARNMHARKKKDTDIKLTAEALKCF